MRQPPPLRECRRYPVTTSIAVMAIGATLLWWNGTSLAPFMFDGELWLSQPWRLVAPALFHGDLLHLIFNLYWLWVFGSLVEDVFGRGRTLAIDLFLAAGSQAAEVAIFDGGVGLSGVVYGLFGMLWVLERKDRRFRDAVDSPTVKLFVAWFFLCIVLTAADVWKIANVAHGAGCALGVLLGWTIAERDKIRRWRNAAALAAAFLVCLVGATAARPYVNCSKEIGQDVARLAYRASENGDFERAVRLYERAVAIEPMRPNWWHNLGCAYARLGRESDARRAFARADELEREFGSD